MLSISENQPTFRYFSRDLDVCLWASRYERFWYQYIISNLAHLCKGTPYPFSPYHASIKYDLYNLEMKKMLAHLAHFSVHEGFFIPTGQILISLLRMNSTLTLVGFHVK